MKSFGFLFFLPLLISCSLDYGEELAENMNNTPNSILQGFQLFSVRANKVAYTLKADLIESNNSQAKDSLRGVTVEEYDAKGELRTRGVAEMAVITQGVRDATLTKVELFSRENDASIVAESLKWMENLRQLQSGAQEAVRIERGDGTIIEGMGLFADFNNGILRFDGEVKGEYDEDKKTTDESPP